MLVISQQNCIREDIASKYEILSDIKPMNTLFGEYEGTVAKNKILKLCQTYSNTRKIRPDGNCFYRAALFGAIEASFRVDQSEAFRDKMKEIADGCKRQGYDSFAIDEFHELVDEQIMDAQTKSNACESIRTLEASMKDPSIDGYFVAFARCACGAALKEWHDDYASFLPQEFPSMESFCRNEVDPMYKDADQIQIVALARILGIHLFIAYVDQSEGDEANIIEFGDTSSPIKVHMVYKPGHYDLIYA